MIGSITLCVALVKMRMQMKLLIILSLFHVCMSESVQELPLGPSPFIFVKGKYNDWESKVMDLEIQYCNLGCNKRFSPKTHTSPSCAPCYCDAACYLFDDCCPDKVLFDKAPNNASMSRGYGCTQTLYSKDVKFSKSIDVCPDNYDDKAIVDSCHEQGSLHWRYVKPVTDLTSNITYRNKYCAKCNGAVNVRGWATETKCSRTSDYGTSSNVEEIYFHVLGNLNCSLTFKSGLEDIDTRECIPVQKPFYSRCNETGLWLYYDQEIERACHLYTNVVLGTYKNIFCRLCNDDITWDMLMKEPSGRVTFAKYSMDALLDLGDYDESQMKLQRSNRMDKSESEGCNDEQIVDPLSCKCRTKTCSDRETLVNGTCHSIFSQSNNIGYEVRLCIEGTYNSTGETVEQNIMLANYANLFPNWRTDVEFVKDISFAPLYMVQCESSTVEMQIQAIANVLFLTLVDTDEKQELLIKKVSEAGQDSSRGRYQVETHLGECVQRSLPSMNVAVPGQQTQIPTCVSLPTFSIMTNIPYTVQIADYIPRFNFFKLNKLMTCTQVLVNSTEADLSGNRLTILHNNITLTAEEYEVRGEKYAVCLENFLNGTESPSLCEEQIPIIDTSTTTPLGITSVVCSCISLLFLIISFIFYCVVKPLRNVVGVNVMGLIVTLFFAQLIYEFGLEMTDFPDLCQAIGILIHYFWLSSTFWMNACTFVLFYKLSFPLNSRGYGTRHVFNRCLLYSMLTPFAIVGITLAVNFGTMGYSGYGGSYSCYIQSVNERRFAFALPMGLLIITNIVLFTYTFIKIRITQMESAMNRENKINILACLKLSVITGALWIFAFIYEATRAIVFAYFFTILVGAQGVLIFFAFIVNRRVCQICAETMGHKSEHSQSSTTTKNKYVPSTTDSPLSSASRSTSKTKMLSKREQDNIEEGSV